MALRLFVFVGGDQVAAFEASCVPRVGEAIWCKTLDFEGSAIVESVEHQFDKSRRDGYGNHDVCLYCRAK